MSRYKYNKSRSRPTRLNWARATALFWWCTGCVLPEVSSGSSVSEAPPQSQHVLTDEENAVVSPAQNADRNMIRQPSGPEAGALPAASGASGTMTAGVQSTCEAAQFRCDGNTLQECNPATQHYEKLDTCVSAAFCDATYGSCRAPDCLPGSGSCQGNVLHKCNADGTQFVDEACGDRFCSNAHVACDVCEPGSTECDGDILLTCNTDGTGKNPHPCPTDLPLCIRGQCVQCVTNAECPRVGECYTAVCNMNLRCGAQPIRADWACSVGASPGRCDGHGKCVITQG